MQPTTHESALVSELLGQSRDAAVDQGERPLRDVLSALRSHLDMDVAFVSEFIRGRRVFRHVDPDGRNQPIHVGDSDPLEESYCQRIVDGRLPGLIPDAAKVPAAMELPVTKALPVGAHLSVPIRLSDGSIYGTLCCFSHRPDYTLNERDLAILRMCAELASKQIEREREEQRHFKDVKERLERALASDDPAIVYQPICDLGSGTVVGFESLSRFETPPTRTPDVWFNEAAQIGMIAELELTTIRKALRSLEALDEHLYLSVNISPETIVSGSLEPELSEWPLERIVLEITEHAIVSAYAEIVLALGPLRRRGLRLAVDDAGAGYASFRHILALTPDIIKLDMSLTRDIDQDASKRALTSALVEFARNTGSQIVAEGVETGSELSVLRKLGVAKGQGYRFGRPGPLESLAERRRTVPIA